MVYNYCPNFIGHSMLLLPLSWSVALSSTTFPHTSQTRPTTTSQKWCLSSTMFPHTSQTRPTTTSQKGCLSPAIPLTNTSSSSSSHHCLTSIVTWITCWLHVTYHYALAIYSNPNRLFIYSFHNVHSIISNELADLDKQLQGPASIQCSTVNTVNSLKRWYSIWDHRHSV